MTELLQHCNKQSDYFCGPSGNVMNFDLLMGLYAMNDSEKKQINFDEEISKIDKLIEEEKAIEAAMTEFDC